MRADTKREIERKYEATPDTRVPDLTGVAGVSAVVGRGVAELDAVYYDTPGLRLAADSITLRRRTGGADAGWHLKFPVGTGVRDEIRAPLAETPPDTLRGLLRSRVRESRLEPVVRLHSSRDVHHLVDDRGALLAELSVDTVHAQRLTDGGGKAAWTEIEVELADDVDPSVLDALEKRLKKAGIRPSSAPSKLARALEETGNAPGAPGAPAAPGDKKQGDKKQKGKAKAKTRQGPDEDTAAALVLAHLRHQVEALVALDPGVRRDLPDAVHKMRVATRRLRSAFKSYGKILDRNITDPLGDELKWLAAELGVARDQEVLSERLRERIDAVPTTLLLGPVQSRLRVWAASHETDARRRTLEALDSERYLTLLDTLDALLAAPPLRPAASKDPAAVLAKAVLKDYARLARRVEHALTLPPGHDRDLAMHQARKAAKRARYAAEAAEPAVGKPAKRLAKRVKAVQRVLGDHQDSVVARDALRTLAIQAHAAGESAFVWGLLHGQEQAAGADRERELPEVWARASAPELRAALSS